jgi:hypothetical protein
VEQLDSHKTDCDEIWYLRFLFRKSVDKIQVSLKSDKNDVYFNWRHFHIYDSISLNSSWNEKYVDKKVVEKIETHFVFNIFFSRKSCCLSDNVENMVEPERSQMTTQYGAYSLHGR